MTTVLVFLFHATPPEPLFTIVVCFQTRCIAFNRIHQMTKKLYPDGVQDKLLIVYILWYHKRERKKEIRIDPV
jgi:hypothetical protein